MELIPSLFVFLLSTGCDGIKLCIYRHLVIAFVLSCGNCYLKFLSVRQNNQILTLPVFRTELNRYQVIQVILMGNIGMPEIMLIFLVVLLVFGAKRIPEIARGLGKGIREFKDATTDIKRELDVNDDRHRIQSPRQGTNMPRTDTYPTAQPHATPAQPAATENTSAAPAEPRD